MVKEIFFTDILKDTDMNRLNVITRVFIRSMLEEENKKGEHHEIM